MRKVLQLFRYFSDKRFSTIAGTLVYFLLMSIAPFILWLTLVCGNVDIERFISHELFDSVSPFLRYLKSSAESAAGGAGIIFLLKGGLKLRLASVVLIFAAIFLFAVLGGVLVVGSRILDRLLPFYLSDLVLCTFLTASAFAVILVLNLFACPYKLKLFDAVPGSLLTTALWLVFLIGFSVYTQFANPEKLYGRIASLIIFLVWCYAMMSCFVIGIIYNGMFKTKKEYKTLL